jgi:DNA-binding protein H-NS
MAGLTGRTSTVPPCTNSSVEMGLVKPHEFSERLLSNANASVVRANLCSAPSEPHRNCTSGHRACLINSILPGHSQVSALFMKGKIADGEARERLIIWIRRRMAEFGITPQALAESIESDLKHPPIYRDAHGNEWNGEGQVPHWLSAARNAGVDPEFFRIAEERETRTNQTPRNPRQLDLFSQR